MKVPLVVIESPYRSLLGPLLAYIDALRETRPQETIVWFLAEFVPRRWCSTCSTTRRRCGSRRRCCSGPE